MKGINLHLYSAPLVRDSRSRKESKSIEDYLWFDKILMLGIQAPNVAQFTDISKEVRVERLKVSFYHKLPFLKSICFYLEWYVEIWKRVKKEKISVVQCHGINELVIGVFLKWRKKSKLIYDAHELETERNGSKGIVNLYLKFIEWFLIRFADEVLVVSPSILEWYENKYKGNSITLLRNLPKESLFNVESHQFNLKESLGIPDNDVLYIYLGALLKNRGVEVILECFSKSSTSNHVVFVGFGDYDLKIKEYAKEYKNIHYKKPVEPSEVIGLTRSADVGLCLVENSCLSHYYCLPNKLFEYILAGVPIISSNFPDLSGVVNEKKCGWLVEPNAGALLNAIEKIDKNIVDLTKQRMSENPLMESWETEEIIYINAYKRMLKK